jgi:hypothetical protein
MCACVRHPAGRDHPPPQLRWKRKPCLVPMSAVRRHSERCVYLVQFYFMYGVFKYFWQLRSSVCSYSFINFYSVYLYSEYMHRNKGLSRVSVQKRDIRLWSIVLRGLHNNCSLSLLPVVMHLTLMSERDGQKHVFTFCSFNLIQLVR